MAKKKSNFWEKSTDGSENVEEVTQSESDHSSEPKDSDHVEAKPSEKKVGKADQKHKKNSKFKKPQGE